MVLKTYFLLVQRHYSIAVRGIIIFGLYDKKHFIFFKPLPREIDPKYIELYCHGASGQSL